MRFDISTSAAVLIAALIVFSGAARAVSDRAIDYLGKTAPRPAGMGGAFTAVGGDPIGLVWNPSAALRSDRFSFSRNHSLRHFPGDKRNLDQFDSDTVGVVIPVQGEGAVGVSFTIPGEWGIDHADTNGLLTDREKLRGRERRISYSELGGSRGNAAFSADSNWFRYDDIDDASASNRSFETGGMFSFYYEADDGMRYGVSLRGLVERIKGKGDGRKRKATATFGVAYRPDEKASTLLAADFELCWKDDLRTRWFAGAEREFDGRYFIRAGSMNGLPTYGAGAEAGSVRLDFATVKNLLPKVTGNEDVKEFQDGHFISYTVSM